MFEKPKKKNLNAFWPYLRWTIEHSPNPFPRWICNNKMEGISCEVWNLIFWSYVENMLSDFFLHIILYSKWVAQNTIYKVIKPLDNFRQAIGVIKIMRDSAINPWLIILFLHRMHQTKRRRKTMNRESSVTKDVCLRSKREICYDKPIWIVSLTKSIEFEMSKLHCNVIWIPCCLNWAKFYCITCTVNYSIIII